MPLVLKLNFFKRADSEYSRGWKWQTEVRWCESVRRGLAAGHTGRVAAQRRRRRKRLMTLIIWTKLASKLDTVTHEMQLPLAVSLPLDFK